MLHNDQDQSGSIVSIAHHHNTHIFSFIVMCVIVLGVPIIVFDRENDLINQIVHMKGADDDLS